MAVPNNKVLTLLDKLHDKKWIETFLKARKHSDRVALLRNYNTDTQEEEQIIQVFIDKFDPAVPSVTKEGQVRHEMGKLEATGQMPDNQKLDTREGEAYWQKRLDDAKAVDAAELAADKQRRMAEIRKLLPALGEILDIEDEETVVSTGKVPAISVGATGKAQLKEDTLPEKTELSMVSGFSKDILKAFSLAKITKLSELYSLTYEQALKIAGNELSLAQIKSNFAKK